MERNSVVKGIALIAPFAFILSVMLLFGGTASRFFLGLFSGYEVHQEGPYTFLTTKGGMQPGRAAKTLDTFVTEMVQRYGENLHIAEPDPTTSDLKIYLLDSAEALEKFGLQRMNRDLAHNGGYFLPTKREIALVLTGNREIDDRGLRHEMMHALMHLSNPEATWPNWFAEGMASFFEHSIPDEMGWHPGGLPGKRPPKGTPIPLKTLLEAGGKNFTSEDNRLFYHSAQMLVEFLFTMHREKLFEYYNRARNEEGDGAFSASFGNLVPLEKAWLDYLKKRK